MRERDREKTERERESVENRIENIFFLLLLLFVEWQSEGRRRT
jgi:hypothetical protein